VRAAALIIDDRGLLLVRQRRLERTYWLLPGGGVRFGESLADALRRELFEELALDVVPGRPIAVAEAISTDMAAYPKHVVHVVLEARAARSTAVGRPSDDAILEMRYVTRAEIADLTITPPIAPFLQSCFDAPPRGMTYLGIVW
jgi:ADP-ribose pyrophosphatase YjhB (NUDIX family)